MNPLRITSAGCYRQPQHLKQIRDYQSLCLMIAGAQRLVHGARAVPHRLPLLYWGLRGERFESLLDADRENWIVLFEGPELSATADPERVRWRDGEHDLDLPRYLPVGRAELPGLRAEFARLRELLLQPDPLSRCLLRLGFGALLARMLAPAARPLGGDVRDPVGHLKELLDDEALADEPIAGLARRCGGSRDHLRRRFAERHGMTPQRYRSERQIARAARLLAETDLAVKQVASAVGFASPAAFSAACRRLTGKTPSELARGGGQGL
jgi:AraC-like DNA-binding protein